MILLKPLILKITILVSFFFYNIVLLSAQNKLSAFENLVGKTWKADGQWGDGSTFKQESTFNENIEGQLITVKSNGFINKELTQWGERNFGIRKWDDKKGTIVFTEYDVFGGKTQGTVSTTDNGDIIYQYPYGESTVTDYWKKINASLYKFTVGIYNNNKFEQIFLETYFKCENEIKAPK